MTLFGLDVSQWQGTPDYRTVAAQGITFVVAKATEGTGFIDATYAPNAAAISKAGLLAGAYHWLWKGDGAAQADHFHATVGDLSGRLAMLDIEDPTNTPTRADVDAFVARFRALYPNKPLLQYGGRYGPLVKASSAVNGPLWLANYGANTPGTPQDVYAQLGDGHPLWASGFAGWAGPTIWQYGSQGAVAGITGNVDINAFRGTLAELTALTGQEGEPMKIQTKIEQWTLDGNPASKVTTLGAPIGPDGTPDWTKRLASLSDTGGINPFLALIDRARLTDPDASQDGAFRTAFGKYAFPAPPALPADTTPFAQADLDAAAVAQAAKDAASVAAATQAAAEAQKAADDARAALLTQSGDLEKLQTVIANIRAALPT